MFWPNKLIQVGVTRGTNLCLENPWDVSTWCNWCWMLAPCCTSRYIYSIDRLRKCSAWIKPDDWGFEILYPYMGILRTVPKVTSCNMTKNLGSDTEATCIWGCSKASKTPARKLNIDTSGQSRWFTLPLAIPLTFLKQCVCTLYCKSHEFVQMRIHVW